MKRADTKWAIFVQHLASGKTIAEAGQAVGISRSTALRWAKRPDVQEAVRAAQADMLARTLARLSDGASSALQWLQDVGGDKLAAPTARVSAARAWLDALLGLRQHLDFEERLRRLEETIDGQRG